MHITGVQHLAGRFVKLLHRANLEYNFFASLIGQEIDHLPMTEPDWAFSEWALQRIRADAWRQPAIVAFEYGGISGAWEAITERDALARDVPRLYEMVKGIII